MSEIKLKTEARNASKLHRSLILFLLAYEQKLRHWPNFCTHSYSKMFRRSFDEVLDLTTDAQHSFYKKTALNNLIKAHERLRIRMWAYYEMGLFSYVRNAQKDEEKADERYLHLSGLWDEIGCQIGNWMESEKAKAIAAQKAKKSDQRSNQPKHWGDQ